MPHYLHLRPQADSLHLDEEAGQWLCHLDQAIVEISVQPLKESYLCFVIYTTLLP
jgi:hypothetical protein